jgi:hypothetical protein
MANAKSPASAFALPAAIGGTRGLQNQEQCIEGSGIRARAIKLKRSNYFFLRAFFAFLAFLAFFAMASSFRLE